MFFSEKLRIVALVSFLVIAIAGCGGSKEREQEYLNRAQTYFDKGNYDKTKVEIKNVLQINPKNLDARYLMALLAEKDQDWRKMYGLIMGVLEEKPDFIDAQNKMGKLYLVSNESDKALEISAQVLAKDPNNIDALLLQAAVLMRTGEIEKSQEILISVLERNPESVDASMILAKQYQDSKNYKEALRVVDNAIKEHPDNLALALFKINALVGLKSFEEAEAIYLPQVERFPDNASLRYSLVQFYLVWGKADKAEQVLRDYVESMPDAVEPKLALVQFTLKQKGQEDARELLQNYINVGDETYQLRFSLAKLYKDDTEKAVQILNEIADTDKEGNAGLKANNLLAIFAVRSGQKEKGQAILDSIIETDPSNSDALLLRASLLIDQGNFEAAIADLRMVMRDDPDSEKAHMLSANAHLKSGFFDLAEQSLEKTLLINPKNTLARKDLAGLRVRDNNLNGAIELLEAAQAEGEVNGTLLTMLADLYIKTKQWDKAIAIANTMPDPDNLGLSSFTLAKIYFAQAEYQKSSEEYVKVLAIQPLAVDVIAQLSKCYLLMEAPEKAEKLLDGLVAEHPDNIAILFLRGALYESMKQPELALQTFEKIIAKNDQFVPAYRSMVSVYGANKDINNVIATFKRGLVAIPENTGFLMGLANAYEVKAEWALAIETYQRLLKIDPTSDIAANNAAALIANTSKDPEQLRYALSLVQQNKDYKAPQFVDTYAWLNYLNGNYKEALAAMEKVIAIAPDFPEFQYHLGMIYAANGRTEEAKLSLEQAVSDDAQFVGVEEAKAKITGLR